MTTVMQRFAVLAVVAAGLGLSAIETSAVHEVDRTEAATVSGGDCFATIGAWCSLFSSCSSGSCCQKTQGFFLQPDQPYVDGYSLLNKRRLNCTKDNSISIDCAFVETSTPCSGS